MFVMEPFVVILTSRPDLRVGMRLVALECVIVMVLAVHSAFGDGKSAIPVAETIFPVVRWRAWKMGSV